MPRCRQGPPPPLCAGLDGSHPAAACGTRCCGLAGPGGLSELVRSRERSWCEVGVGVGVCHVAGCGGVQPASSFCSRVS